MAGKPITAESADLTTLIALLHIRTGLSFDQIAHRLRKDFAIDLTREAVWQRYKRWEKQQ